MRMVKSDPARIAPLVDPIRESGSVPDDVVRSVFEHAEGIPQLAIGVVTRFLTMKRPDLSSPSTTPTVAGFASCWAPFRRTQTRTWRWSTRFDDCRRHEAHGRGIRPRGVFGTRGLVSSMPSSTSRHVGAGVRRAVGESGLDCADQHLNDEVEAVGRENRPGRMRQRCRISGGFTRRRMHAHATWSRSDFIQRMRPPSSPSHSRVSGSKRMVKTWRVVLPGPRGPPERRPRTRP